MQNRLRACIAWFILLLIFSPASPQKETPAAPPRADSETSPTPRARRRVVWLILLMVALGSGAMAAAYFWPELYDLYDQ